MAESEAHNPDLELRVSQPESLDEYGLIPAEDVTRIILALARGSGRPITEKDVKKVVEEYYKCLIGVGMFRLVVAGDFVCAWNESEGVTEFRSAKDDKTGSNDH